MKKGYLKFKRRAICGALTKAILFGLAWGAGVSSGWFLLDKLLGNDARWMYYGVAGGGVALVMLSLMLIRVFPTDRRLAKRLDASLQLGEKVQTMVEYRDDDGVMAQMQREDTDRILWRTPSRRARKKHLWLHLVTPFLACALVVSAVLVPAKAEEVVPPPVDPPFRLSDWQEMALRQLIQEVKTSTMDVEPKGDVVEDLENLLTDAKAATKESEMKQLVVACIVDIHRIVTDYNTYHRMAAAMGAADSDAMNTWGKVMDKGDVTALGQAINNTRQTLVGTMIKESLATLIAGLNQVLLLAPLDQSDALYRHTDAFAQSLQGIVDEADGMETVALTEALDMAFKSANGDLSGAVQQQCFNEKVRDNTINTLMSIFGVSWEELPEEIMPTQRGESEDASDDLSKDEDDDKQQASGGMGNAEVQYGSDDVIYDIDREGYYKYGEVINDYYQKISERMVDGSLSEELEEILNNYFGSLLSKDKSENNN